ncbi:amidohydrolase family protein [Ramlibacter sp. AW1]|uniref:Amidohydrolase family protein n=1 Tax=Ramlibacter aurantiacus TaxID=2801330 RepID=A0A937D4N8_9BURK|nr:amidohydrolase family protein [Ramlibacter aurantiacus]MBL0421910.1 amidohydrolase family protein [Ramlibacter aurantiacus]
MTNTTGDTTVLRGQVLDGTLGSPIADGAVVVSGERIAWVGDAARLPDAYRSPGIRVLGGPGHTVMPGLIDGHIHISFGEARSEEELALYTPVEYRAIRAVWNARKVLRAGVTSAFDAATTYNVAASVRDAIEAGMFEGPRLAVAGRQLTTHQGLEDSFPSSMQFPPGQAGVLVRSRDEIVEAIRLQVKDGVDVIKVSGSSDSAITDEPLDSAAFTAEEFQLIAQETHRLQRKCTVHARSRESVLHAARAGFDWIMHASYIDDEGIELCLKNRIGITPTLTLLANIVDSAGESAGASIIDVFKAEMDAAAENLGRAYRAGVPLVCGSESGWSLVPYGQWHAKELEIFVKLLGLTPLQAIHAATDAASRCLPRWSGRIGRLQENYLADVLLVSGDPLQDIRTLQDPQRIATVMKGGRIVDTTTPIPPRRVWPYEKHRTFLPGTFHYNRETRSGEVKP